MINISERIQKALRFIQIFFIETFQKCSVVKMSAYFDNKGNLQIANWGDDINYWLFQEICTSRIISFDWSIRARLFNRPYVMGIGSILTMFNIDNSVIWGSGILRPDKPFRGKPREVRAVRGPLTRQKLLESGIDCPEVYGDPALLLPLYYQPKVKKKYKLGVIQQFHRVDNPLLDTLRQNPDVLIIRIGQYKSWLDFVDEVCMCETIISSSLHGLIVSEAYKIPNVWTVIDGDNPIDFFKYHDFFLSLGHDREPMCVYEPITREQIQANIDKWKPSEIDLKPLLDSCPLPLKKNHKISR